MKDVLQLIDFLRGLEGGHEQSRLRLNPEHKVLLANFLFLVIKFVTQYILSYGYSTSRSQSISVRCVPRNNPGINGGWVFNEGIKPLLSPGLMAVEMSILFSFNVLYIELVPCDRKILLFFCFQIRGSEV